MRPEHPTRTPDELLTDLDSRFERLEVEAGRAILWEIIEDIRSSYRLAITNRYGENETTLSIETEVTDYLVNHYGDD